MGTTGIYIQVPFCQTKCTYCNFHTGVVAAGRYAPYSAAVCTEIQQRGALWGAAGVRIPEGAALVDTVYIGGGTPSLLEPALLTTILDTIRAQFACAFRELTLEADPETVDTHKAANWVAAGINRISFGAQSFIDDELKAAGRMHRRMDIHDSSKILRAAGIENISFDLIAGLPKQTAETWRMSIEETLVLSPEHISIYMMEIDEGSRLGLEVLQGGARYSAKDLPAEESMAEFYETAQLLLKRAGYEQYEISNWSKPGFASIHNLKYWQREPYFGFGAGAHSFSGSQRWANAHDAAAYVDAIGNGRSPIETLDEMTRAMALEEEVFLGLRQLAGINVRRIEQQYDVNFQNRIRELATGGLLEQSGQFIRLPADKLSVSNEIIVEFLR